MQRLFAMFPTGLPGLALALLRAAVAMTLALHATTMSTAMPRWAAVAVPFALLVLGAWTPVVAIAVAAAEVGLGVVGAAPPAAVAIAAVQAVAVALLGPGAYSIDARRYGRRVLPLDPMRRR